MAKITKLELFNNRKVKTGQTYKNQPLFVGDVWVGKFGVQGIVINRTLEDGSTKYFYCKTNTAEHALPEDKVGFNDGEYVGNVCEDEKLLKTFIDCGIIEDAANNIAAPIPPTEPVAEAPKEEPKEEKKPARKKAAKKEEVAEEIAEPLSCETSKNHVPLLKKINDIRVAWANTDIEKKGLGRAGGNSKYEYYKPQQVIDFCLAEEVKRNLYSKFDTVKDDAGNITSCLYKVVDIDTGECEKVECPFDVPRKMACSEAQQIGAALTYYNRRLAMLMYKIEDNSRESVIALDDADYTSLNTPEIPAPPVIIPPVPTPIATPKAEAPKVEIPKVEAEPEKSTTPPWEEEKETPKPATEQVEKQVKEVAEAPAPTVPAAPTIPTPPPVPSQAEKTAAAVPPPPVAPAKEAEPVKTVEPPKTKNIEDLY